MTPKATATVVIILIYLVIGLAHGAETFPGLACDKFLERYASAERNLGILLPAEGRLEHEKGIGSTGMYDGDAKDTKVRLFCGNKNNGVAWFSLDYPAKQDPFLVQRVTNIQEAAIWALTGWKGKKAEEVISAITSDAVRTLKEARVRGSEEQFGYSMKVLSDTVDAQLHIRAGYLRFTLAVDPE
jgi:hypothetical protein